MVQPNILEHLVMPNSHHFNCSFSDGFLAAIPNTTDAMNNKKSILKKLEKELGFDLVERLMQV